MLFRKKIEHSCAYCTYGTRLDDCMILCSRCGLKREENSCRKFRYDPCKRILHKEKAPEFSRFQDEDFSL